MRYIFASRGFHLGPVQFIYFRGGGGTLARAVVYTTANKEVCGLYTGITSVPVLFSHCRLFSYSHLCVVLRPRESGNRKNVFSPDALLLL